MDGRPMPLLKGAEEFTTINYAVKVGDDEPAEMRAVIELSQHLKPDEVVYCLQILLGDKHCISLVLRVVESQNIYERIGVVATDLVNGGARWYGRHEEDRTVTII